MLQRCKTSRGSFLMCSGDHLNRPQSMGHLPSWLVLPTPWEMKPRKPATAQIRRHLPRVRAQFSRTAMSSALRGRPRPRPQEARLQQSPAIPRRVVLTHSAEDLLSLRLRTIISIVQPPWARKLCHSTLTQDSSLIR